MAKKKTSEREAAEVDRSFVPVVDAFAKDQRVSRRMGKGFGSHALKVNDKIFAMMSSKGQFVVKLPGARVDELVSRGKGERFDPGHGRLMKEWVAVGAGKADWVELAREACDFVKCLPAKSP